MLKHEFARFLLTGATNTLVSYSVYLLINLWVPYALAYTLAYGFGIFFSYWLNTRWVFQTRASMKSFLVFPSVYAVQYALSMVLLHILIERMGLSEQWAPLLVIVITSPVTFLMARYIIKPSATTTEKLR